MGISRRMLAVLMAVIVGIGCNIPTIYAYNDCAATLTFIENKSDFNPNALREGNVRVSFITKGEYVKNELNSEYAVKLTMDYVSNGSLLWTSFCGFICNPRVAIDAENDYITMKVNIAQADSEKHFYLMDNNSEKAYIPISEYFTENDYGKWTQVAIPLSDFYAKNMNLSREKLFSVGIAWVRTSATTKTNSTPAEEIYITDMKLCSMETPYAYISDYNTGKLVLEWNKVDKAQGYRIYFNDELIGETELTQYSADAQYTGGEIKFSVCAVDAYGNESVPSYIDVAKLNINSGERVAYIIHDDNLPTAGYFYCWPNSQQPSSGKYISYSTQSDAYSGEKSQKITFPPGLKWGSFSFNYGYVMDFTEFLNKTSLTLRLKTYAVGNELTLRLADSLGNEIDLGQISYNGSGQWEKVKLPLNGSATDDFLWSSVKSVQLVYTGANRLTSLDVLVDLVQLEYNSSDYFVVSEDENPGVLNPNTTYYAICEAADESQSMYAVYYDKDGRMKKVTRGNRLGNIFIAVIRTDSTLNENDKIKFVSVKNTLEPMYKAGVILPEYTKDLDLNTGKWYSYIQPDYSKIAGTALDMSAYLDAPAGKHGFIECDGDNFVFEDGTVADFWGVNLVGQANFLQKSEIDTLVEALAVAGVNLVRVHHLDADYYSPNIFGSDKNSVTLDKNQMDKFNYLWYKLKEKGIYIMPSLLCGRKVTASMGITDASSIDSGMKIEGMFDETLIQMQKDYARALLTYENPYTGTTLATDPASVMFEIHNECNITRYGEYQTYAINSSYYYNQFTSMFTGWLLEKYGTRNNIASAWGEKVASSGNIDFPYSYLSKGYTAAHIKDCRLFLDYVAKKYHNEMISYVKDELGVKVPVAGTNNSSSNNLGDVYENASYDYMDRHQYWSHPTNGYSVEAGLVTAYPGMVLKATNANPFYMLAKNTVFGRPTLISEWQSGLPSAYSGEIQMIAASVFAYQGYSSCQFDFLNGPMISENKMGDVFGILGNPLRYGALPAAAAAYYTTDEAQSGYWMACDEDKAMDYTQQSASFEPLAFMIGKCGWDMESVTGVKAQSSSDFLSRLYQAKRSGIYESSTGELCWNTNDSIYTINSPYVRCASGFIKGKEISLGEVDINVGNDFASVSITTPQLCEISNADTLLVTALARGENTGYKTDASATTVTNAGTAPIILEQVEGCVKIDGEYDVYVLSSSGERKRKANSYMENGKTVLEMGISDRTMHYEFVRK